MIGAVFVDGRSSERVWGLSVAMRAVLALQAAGATRVVLIGEGGASMVPSIVTDDRVRVPVESAGEWPTGETCVVAAGVVIDARAARDLAQRATGTFSHAQGDQGAWALAKTAHAVTEFIEASRDVPHTEPAAGVCVRVAIGGTTAPARRALMDSLRKPQDGWISRSINRHVSLAFTRMLVGTSLRPNQVSVGILAIGIAAGIFAARGTWGALALGGFLFQMQSILDGCDGELSRLGFRGSRLGEWLDTVGDDVTNYGYFAGATWGVHVMTGSSWVLYVGAVGVAVGIVTSGIEYRYLIRIGSGDLLKYPLGFGADPEPARDVRGLAAVLGAIRPLFKRDTFVFAAMLAAFAGAFATSVMLALFAAGALATFMAVLASEWRRRGRVF